MIAKKDLDFVATTLPSIVKVKADVVEQDPAETGKRAILNLGHTLGHAVEGVSQKLTKDADTILHGEAVGVGMMFAIFLSTKLSGLAVTDASSRINILKLVSKVSNQSVLKTFFAGKDPGSSEVISELQRFITQDKKATGTAQSQSQWILFTSSGEVKGPSNHTWTYTLDMSSFPSLWQEFLKIYC
jgi:3-dehydroquinate synthetase